MAHSEEYIATIDGGAGMRILVHNQSTMPTADTKGIGVPTGFATSIAISRVSARMQMWTFQFWNRTLRMKRIWGNGKDLSEGWIEVRAMNLGGIICIYQVILVVEWMPDCFSSPIIAF